MEIAFKLPSSQPTRVRYVLNLGGTHKRSLIFPEMRKSGNGQHEQIKAL